MIKQASCLGGAAILMFVFSGCGKTDTSPTAGNTSPEASAAHTAATTSASENATVAGQRIGGASPRPGGDGPEAAVWDFLEAVRTGSDAQANKMLTPLARTKVGEKQMSLAPPGTDTARFVIGKVERLAEDGARVSVDWTDLDYNGKSRTDQTIWMVRKETEGWRIAGMAVPIFEGEPMVLMNFEDPDDMLQKQKIVHEEIQRRAQGKSAENIPSVEGPVLTNNQVQQTSSQTQQTSSANVSTNQVPASVQAPAASSSANSANQPAAAPENSFRR